MTKFVEAVVEAFDEGTLGEKLVLPCLFPGLDFLGGGAVFEAEEEGAGVFEVLGRLG